MGILDKERVTAFCPVVNEEVGLTEPGWPSRTRCGNTLNCPAYQREAEPKLPPGSGAEVAVDLRKFLFLTIGRRVRTCAAVAAGKNGVRIPLISR